MFQFAIIGCGRIGEVHAKQMAARGKLKAVCDIDAEKANKLAALYNATPYFAVGSLLSNEHTLSLVSVCTPNGLHAEHSILILERGIHVICEKPMALLVEDCRRMIKVAEEVRKHLFVVKQNRFNPPVKFVKQLIENQSLGKIFSANLNCFWNRNLEYYQDSWRGTLQNDGGTLFTQFSHFIDLLYWFFGDVKSIVGFSENYAHKEIIDFEDTGAAVMKFDSGVLASISYTVNAYNKNMEGSLSIFGEKGTVKIGGQYLNELDYVEMLDTPSFKIASGNPPNRYGKYEGSMSNHGLVYDNVIEVINGKAKMTTTPEEALKSVEIINRIYKVIRKTTC
jgi:UDP-N-acetyl-2-amino-2-deoxyglucuronate dehydrogenase